MHGLRNFAVNCAGGDFCSFPQIFGVLGGTFCKLLGAERLAVFQQTDLSHLVSQIVNVLAFSLDAPFLSDADQLIGILDLIVTTFLGLVQSVHDFTAVVGVRSSTAGGEDQVVTGDDAVNITATDTSGALGGDTAGTHRTNAAAGAGFAEAAVRSLIFDSLLPCVSANFVCGFQQSVGGSFHLFDRRGECPILQCDFLLNT